MIIVTRSETKRGPKPIGPVVMTATQRSRKHRKQYSESQLENIAVLDFETDPFDDKEKTDIKPFLAVLYSDNFSPIIIWEENIEKFVDAVLAAILALPDKYTIYAHNGGKFDYMFLVHKLRGFVSFKGRGIMSAKVGPHELRDSLHIIPEKLASFQKDAFDYNNMKRGARDNHRETIIEYCINDCRYLLSIVKSFVKEFGFKISIGQAAMYELKKEYTVKNIGPNLDTYLRKYFFGGRVECLMGMGHFTGAYKLYDVNSMYPYVMATKEHPVGNEYTIRPGRPGPKTVFLQLTCKNYGALVRRGENNETSANEEFGTFFTTIWEYECALKYNLIADVSVLFCVDCDERSNFSRFVEPLYEKRQLTKRKLKVLENGSHEYLETKKDDIFYKLVLNNAYGKFAQNPRRFKEHYLTDHGERPPAEQEGFGTFPTFESDGYDIWERPNTNFRFNNVGTAASITGAARAVLMEAIQLADDPIYCDTDSLICRGLHDLVLDGEKLGAWDVEAEFDEVLIAGKKLYACKLAGKEIGQKGAVKVRSKGSSGLTWQDMLKIIAGEIVKTTNKAPTLTKQGRQYYLTRNVRATAKPRITENERLNKVRVRNIQRISARR